MRHRNFCGTRRDIMRSRIPLIALAALAALAGSLPAGAATAQLVWKDLDLSTESGRVELDRRIEAVATKACQRDRMTGSYLRKPPTPECLADARAQMETKLSAKLPQYKDFAAASRGAPESR
jgi:UrcA family protein